jgi:hypothetical protein
LDQIGDTGGNYGDYTSLGDSTNNRYLFYKKERPTEGVSQPKVNFKKRPSSGMTFPRRRLR